jgi:hypothetical protein
MKALIYAILVVTSLAVATMEEDRKRPGLPPGPKVEIIP